MTILIYCRNDLLLNWDGDEGIDWNGSRYYPQSACTEIVNSFLPSYSHYDDYTESWVHFYMYKLEGSEVKDLMFRHTEMQEGWAWLEDYVAFDQNKTRAVSY